MYHQQKNNIYIKGKHDIKCESQWRRRVSEVGGAKLRRSGGLDGSPPSGVQRRSPGGGLGQSPDKPKSMS